MYYHKEQGFTLIEVLFSVVLLIIAITGAIQYRYHAAIETRKANMRNSGAQLAMMLIETWRAADGADTFDTEAHFNSAITITPSTGPACPVDYNPVASYAINWSDYDYEVTLSSRDIGGGLRSLNVAIAWLFGKSGINKEYRITTYVDRN